MFKQQINIQYQKQLDKKLVDMIETRQRILVTTNVSDYKKFNHRNKSFKKIIPINIKFNSKKELNDFFKKITLNPPYLFENIGFEFQLIK